MLGLRTPLRHPCCIHNQCTKRSRHTRDVSARPALSRHSRGSFGAPLTLWSSTETVTTAAGNAETSRLPHLPPTPPIHRRRPCQAEAPLILASDGHGPAPLPAARHRHYGAAQSAQGDAECQPEAGQARPQDEQMMAPAPRSLLTPGLSCSGLISAPVRSLIVTLFSFEPSFISDCQFHSSSSSTDHCLTCRLPAPAASGSPPGPNEFRYKPQAPAHTNANQCTTRECANVNE